MTRLDIIQASAARWGWPRALLNIAVKRAARRFGVHVYKVRVRPIAAGSQSPPGHPAISIRQIKADELRELAEDVDLDLPPDFVEEALVRGDLAFGAFDGLQLVAYIWRSTDAAPDADGVWIRVRKPFNYSYKAYTRDSYRGQRIGPLLFIFSDEAMRKLGYEHRVGIVGITNYASLGMSKHTDSRIVGHAGYLAWFGKLMTFRSSAVKEIGLEFFRPPIDL